jgi:hypothetical protein
MAAPRSPGPLARDPAGPKASLGEASPKVHHADMRTLRPAWRTHVDVEECSVHNALRPWPAAAARGRGGSLRRAVHEGPQQALHPPCRPRQRQLAGGHGACWRAGMRRKQPVTLRSAKCCLLLAACCLQTCAASKHEGATCMPRDAQAGLSLGRPVLGPACPWSGPSLVRPEPARLWAGSRCAVCLRVRVLACA